MTDLSSIIERVEKATGPDREIDCQIAFATGHFDFKLRYGFENCRIERGEYRSADWVEVLVKDKGTLIYQETYPPITASIDAAVALAERVLPGWGWGISHGSEKAEDVQGNVFPKQIPMPAHLDIFGYHRHPAMALVLATLKALEVLQ